MPEFLETTVDKFVFRVAADRLYGPDGVWILGPMPDGRIRVGVTDYVQQRSGDVAFVHVRPVGTQLQAGDLLAEFETIKAMLTVAAPAAGDVVAVNEDLDRNPEYVNEDPFGRGWMAAISPTVTVESRGIRPERSERPDTRKESSP